MNEENPDSIRLTVLGQESLSSGAQRFLDEVFGIVSQSDISRTIAKKAQSLGVKLAFDPQFCEMAHCEAMYDPMRDLVAFGDKNRDPLAFAMTLCHELRHFIHAREKSVQVNSDWTPMSMLKLTLASEADTHAHELQMAFELAARKKEDGQSLFPHALVTAEQRLREVPDVQKIIADGTMQPEKVSDGRLMADFFRAFYGSLSLRHAYEDHLINTIKMFPNALFSSRQFQGTLTSADILDAVGSSEKPYIRDHLKNLDLDDAYHSSVYEKTAFQLAFLKSTRDGRIGAKDEPGWKPQYLYGAARGNPRIIPPQP